MVEIFATVGMSSYPFDRLVTALEGLTAEHDVFAQIGMSTIVPSCRWERFVPMSAVLDRIESADVVVTHAGNTVRLVQRRGKVPIAVARRWALGEMNNDHQVEYLETEERSGPVVAVWDLSTLPDAVREHSRSQSRLLQERPPPPEPDPDRIRRVMERVANGVVADARSGRSRSRSR